MNPKRDTRPHIYLNSGLFEYDDDLEREGFDTHQIQPELLTTAKHRLEQPKLRLTESTIRRLHRSYKARRAAGSST